MVVTVTTVVRVAALIRSNLSNCMFGGGICDICSICGVDVVVFLFPTTTIITNTTNITTTTAIRVSFISTFTTLHTLKVKYGLPGDVGDNDIGLVLMVVVVTVRFWC